MTGFAFQNFDTPRGDLICRVSGGHNHCLIVNGDNAIESLSDVAILRADVALGRCDEAWLFSTGSPERDRAAFEAAFTYVGVPYSPIYDFDGPDMFCSALLWHSLREVGHPVPEPIFMRDLNWQPYAKEVACEAARYGLTLEGILGRRVITPKQLADCLVEVDYLIP